MTKAEALEILIKFKDGRANQNSNLCEALQVAIDELTEQIDPIAVKLINTGLCVTCTRGDCEQADNHIDKCNGYIEPTTEECSTVGCSWKRSVQTERT